MSPSISPPGFRARIVAPCFAAFIAAAFQGHGATIANGGFETGNLNGWSTFGTVSVATTLLGGAILPDSGNYMANVVGDGTSAASLAALMGITVSQLRATNGGIVADVGSILYQSFSAKVGDSIQVRWNFYATDYLPFDDWSFYGIRFEGSTEVTKLASLTDIGGTRVAETRIGGWKTLDIDITKDGDYTLYLGAINALDDFGPPGLAVDSITLQQVSPIPEPGSVIALGVLLSSGAFLRSRRNKRSCIQDNP